MTEETAKKKNLKPLARIVSWAQCGVDPSIMGTGPIPASKLALKKAGWKEDQLDLIEANEAFAAQALAVNKKMGSVNCKCKWRSYCFRAPNWCFWSKNFSYSYSRNAKKKSKTKVVPLFVLVVEWVLHLLSKILINKLK